MKKPKFHPRRLLPRVREALRDSPVVLIHGPRQCGKTTLARQVGEADGFIYLSFDDDTQRDAALNDPMGYVTDLPAKVILDEVQHVPKLFTSLKLAVDNNRAPGRFILTGSANILLLPKLADSLAGRMDILRLHPLAQVELTGKKTDFFSSLFQGKFKAGKTGRHLAKALAEKITAGGYPAALARATAHRRTAWYQDYAGTLLQRDIRDLARIHQLDAVSRLLALAAGQTSRLLNASKLAAPFQLSRPTIREYVALLSQIFLLEELQPWHNNRLSRLIKTPKLHLGDTGLACALLGLNADALWSDRAMFGQMLETFIYQELRKQADWWEWPITFSHFRDKDKVEVDFVLECGGKIAGVEVKASSTVSRDDFKGLRKLQVAAGKKFAQGVLLYDGDAVVGFGSGLVAVPVCRLWD